MGLRIATLGARFLFIFFLAKYLEPASVGYYGIFTATVGYSLYFVGLDFYTYATREILRAPETQRGRLVKGQIALSGILYLVFVPVFLAVLTLSGWPGSLIWWFLPVLFLEVLNQEVYRLLIALSQQIAASIILFLRQGSWAIASITLMHLDDATRGLGVVMALWVCGGALAGALGLWKVASLGMGGWRDRIDWGWVRKGIAVSALFLIATLSLRGVQTIDRYWLKELGGIAIVGTYVLSLGVASTLMVFLDAGVFSFAYPELIRHNHAGESEEAQRKVRRMLIQTLVMSAGFAVVSWLLLPYLLAWIDKPIYSRATDFFPWLLLATIINAVSMVPHYALYARGHDRPIVYSHVAALFAFVLTTWAFSGSSSILAVPLGLISAFTLILIWKTAAYQLLMSSENGARRRLRPS